MISYFIRRFLHSLIVLVIVTMCAFMLIRLAPGSPARMMLPDTATEEQVLRLEQHLNLDKPLYFQFWTYVKGLLHGDLGHSTAYRQPVARIIAQRLPFTIQLAVGTVLLGTIMAIPLGIVAGANRGKLIDFFAMVFALLGQSMANVWMAILLIFIFSVRLGWLPALGTGGLRYMVLPVFTLGYSLAAVITRVARSGMIDTLSEDYIVATYAKGIGHFEVITKYALRNALIPVITIIGVNLGVHLSGSVVVETVFAWSGIGQLMNQSVNSRDYAMVQSLLLISAFLFTLINFIVDIINSFIDPRLSLMEK